MAWPSARSVAHEVGQQRERVIERRKIGDLAADMHVDAGDAKAGQRRGRWRRRRGARAIGMPNLFSRFAGRDLGVRVWRRHRD